MSLELILDSIKSYNDIIICQPSDEQKIDMSGSIAFSFGCCSIPEDYKNFLRTCNGMIYQGLELLGTMDYEFKELKYTMPSIQETNKEYEDGLFINGKIILGNYFDKIIIFDEESSLYFFADKLTLTYTKSFEKIETIISEIFNINL